MNKIPKLFTLDNAFSMGAYWVCGGVVIASMTSYFNISVSLANMLAGLTSTLALLQLPGGLIFSTARNKNVLIRALNIIWRILLPLVFFSVLLPQNLGALAFIVTLPLMIGIFQLSAPAQTAWMVDAVQGKTKNSYYSVRETVFMLYHTILLGVVYVIIEVTRQNNTQKQGFIIIGIIVCVSIFVSLIIFALLPNVKQTPNSSVQKKQKNSTLKAFMLPFKNKAFFRVMQVNIMWSFASMFVGTFAAIYQVRTLNLPFSLILVWVTVSNISRALFTPVVQKISQAYSWQRVCQLMMVIYTLGAFVWLFTTKENMLFLYPFAAILTQIPFAGLGIGFLQLQVNTMHKKSERTVHFSLVAMLNGVASLSGSAISSVLITVLSISPNGDLRPIFVIGIVGIIITVIWAQKINMPKNNRARRINETINRIKQKYPNLKFEPLPVTRRKLRMFFKANKRRK